MHSEKLGEEVWIIYDREIWDMIRDERVKYSIEEVDALKGEPTQQIQIVNGWKKRLQFSEVISIERKQKS